MLFEAAGRYRRVVVGWPWQLYKAQGYQVRQNFDRGVRWRTADQPVFARRPGQFAEGQKLNTRPPPGGRSSVPVVGLMSCAEPRAAVRTGIRPGDQLDVQLGLLWATAEVRRST